LVDRPWSSLVIAVSKRYDKRPELLDDRERAMATVIQRLRYGIVVWAALCAFPAATWADPQFGISMLGEPHYKQGFDHFDYVDPNAAKGGRLRQAEFGTFDTLNPFVIRGDIAAGVRELVFDPLVR
jgi:microcin C transport system substrate-binding protein